MLFDWRPPPSPAKLASRRHLSTAAWQHIRAQVIAEEPVCRDCGSTAEPPVDHIIPLADGGTDDRENLARRCRRCNGRRSALRSLARMRAEGG